MPPAKPVSVRRRSIRRAAGLSAVLAVAMPGANSLAVVTEGDAPPPPPPDSTYTAADAGSFGVPLPPTEVEAQAPAPPAEAPAPAPPPPPPVPEPSVIEEPAPLPEPPVQEAAPPPPPPPVPEPSVIEEPAPPPEPPVQEVGPPPPPVPPPPVPEPPVIEPEPLPEPAPLATETQAPVGAKAKITAADAADAGALGVIESQPELVQPEPAPPEVAITENGDDDPVVVSPPPEDSAVPPPSDPIPAGMETAAEDEAAVVAEDVVAPAADGVVVAEPAEQELISGQSAADAGSLGVVEHQPKLVNPDASDATPPADQPDASTTDTATDATNEGTPPVVAVELKTPSAFAAEVGAAPVIPTPSQAGGDAFTIGVDDIAGGKEEPPVAGDPFTLGIDDLRPAEASPASETDAADEAEQSEAPPSDSIAPRTVAEGDNLWTIAAEALGDDAGVPEIASYVDAIVETNDTIDDRDLIPAGVEIDLPVEHHPYVPVSEVPSAEDTPEDEVLIPEFGLPAETDGDDSSVQGGDPAINADEAVAEFGRPDINRAVEILEDRLADSDNPESLDLINPRTGRKFTSEETEDAIRRAEERRADPYVAIEDHARAGRASAETGSIVEPVRPLNLTERIVVSEDKIFNADGDTEDLKLINPATGAGYTDAELVRAEENAIERRIESRSAEFTLDEKVAITRSLGFEVPDNPSPGDIAGIDEILGLLPDDLVGPLVNEGLTVSFDAPVPAAGTPRFGVIPGGIDVGITRSVEVELSGSQMDVGFRETQTFEISMTAGVDVNADAGGRTTLGKIRKWYERVADRSPLPGSPEVGFFGGYRGAGEYNREIGTQLSYEATVDTDQGARLADGDMSVLPDILAPLDMNEGNSLLIRGSTVDTTTIGARYRLIYGEGSSTRLEGMGFGVERIDGDRVVIVAGPISEVEEQLFLGLKKFGVEAGVEAGTTRSISDMSFAELDLSTAAGQEAYQQFLLSGAVPLSSDEGIESSGERITISNESTVGGVLRVGPIGLDATLLDADERVDVTTNPDGSRDLKYVEHHYGKTTEANQVVSADGVVDQAASTYGFVVPDVNRHTAGFNELLFTGSEGGFDGDVDVQVSFTGEELMELSAMADRRVRELAEHYPDPDEAYAAAMASPGGLMESLAAAEDPYQVFILLRGQTGGGLMEHLPSIGLPIGSNPDELAETLPGSIAFNEESG